MSRDHARSLAILYSDLILALLIFYFGFQAMIGPRGLLLVRARNETLQGKVAELDQLKAQRQDLEREHACSEMTASRPIFWRSGRVTC